MLTIKIRKFRLEDIDLLKSGWNRIIFANFGKPQHWINEITKNIDADWVKYFIVECNHQSVSSILRSRQGTSGEWSNEPKGTVGIDYLIGDKNIWEKVLVPDSPIIY